MQSVSKLNNEIRLQLQRLNNIQCKLHVQSATSLSKKHSFNTTSLNTRPIQRQSQKQSLAFQLTPFQISSANRQVKIYPVSKKQFFSKSSEYLVETIQNSTENKSQKLSNNSDVQDKVSKQANKQQKYVIMQIKMIQQMEQIINRLG